MAETRVRGAQILDDDLTSDDLADAAVRGATSNVGTQREIATGTVSTPDLRVDAVDSTILLETDDYTVNSLSITTTLSVTTTSTLTGDVGIGGAPVTDAALAINSTSKAFVLPKLDTTARDAIGTPISGMLIFNTSTSKLNLYTSSWGELSVTETDPLSIHLNGDNSPSTAIDWNQQEIKQVVIHTLAADPGSPVEGQIWYNTTDKQLKLFNGTSNVILG